MTQSYDLVARDIRSVLHTQIACTDFNGHWDYVPFREFNNDGDRVWTNLMSGEWAATQAVRLPFVSIDLFPFELISCTRRMRFPRIC